MNHGRGLKSKVVKDKAGARRSFLDWGIYEGPRLPVLSAFRPTLAMRVHNAQ